MARLDRELIVMVARQFAQPAERLGPATRLVEDLQGDSLDSLELQMRVEARFSVFIEDDAWCSVATIGDIADQITERRAGGDAAAQGQEPGPEPGPA